MSDKHLITKYKITSVLSWLGNRNGYKSQQRLLLRTSLLQESGSIQENKTKNCEDWDYSLWRETCIKPTQIESM